MLSGAGRSSSPAKDIIAPRRDDSNRITKPSRPTGRTAPRSNQNNDDEQTRQWVSQEDSFVLKQAKKKADIRVREGRAKPIDWLAVILRVIDPDRDLLDDDEEEEVQIDVVDPEGVFEGLNDAQLQELESEIQSYRTLEKTNKKNQEYWETMQVICKDRRQKLQPLGPEGRAVSSVAADVDRILAPKSYEQLEKMEEQIKGSIEPGKLADLVILSDDILTVPEKRIREITPLATLVGGKVVYLSDTSGLRFQ